jgi:hypothetical protein
MSKFAHYHRKQADAAEVALQALALLARAIERMRDADREMERFLTRQTPFPPIVPPAVPDPEHEDDDGQID